MENVNVREVRERVLEKFILFEFSKGNLNLDNVLSYSRMISKRFGVTEKEALLFIKQVLRTINICR